MLGWCVGALCLLSSIFAHMLGLFSSSVFLLKVLGCALFGALLLSPFVGIRWWIMKMQKECVISYD